MNDYVFELPPSEYLFSMEPNQCFFKIHQSYLPGNNKKIFIVGALFLKNFYSVFDFDE